MTSKKKIVVAITGASGAIYAGVLLDKLSQLRDQFSDVGIVMSDNAKIVWETELQHSNYKSLPFPFYTSKDFNAPFASGSAGYTHMIVCPCSMGTLGRIASGVSDDLLTRAADVMLKERKKLILVTRETPLNLIHINNMKTVTEAGGIICPATPSFYSRPQTPEAIAATVIDRVLDLCGFEHSSFRWNS
ncbi:MAG: UbiX family flavin prenyltransferase [Bacteroidia bacterium]